MNDMPITLLVLEGTIRPRRQSIKASRFVERVAREQAGVEVVFVDPRDLNLPEDGDEAEYRDPHYSEIAKRADAFFIVMPEYNHSFPSSLKRVLDSEYLETYRHKPVAVAGVSNGDWGGARGVEGLLPVLRSLALLVIQPTVYFKRVDDLFNDEGVMDPTQEARYRKSVEGALKELLWLARALKTARQQEASGGAASADGGI